MEWPKKFERFKYIDPKDLILDPVPFSLTGKVYIRTLSAGRRWGTYLTGSMKKDNAEKLVEEYRKFWDKTQK